MPACLHALTVCCFIPVLCTAKAERLRQAKAEAEKEIGAYRAEREGAYQKKLAEVRAFVWRGGRACARGLASEAYGMQCCCCSERGNGARGSSEAGAAVASSACAQLGTHMIVDLFQLPTLPTTTPHHLLRDLFLLGSHAHGLHGLPACLSSLSFTHSPHTTCLHTNTHPRAPLVLPAPWSVSPRRQT